MATWIALFRGINVGGHRILPMKDLTEMLEGAGFDDVRTYIQSGNVVFRSSKGSSGALGKRIGELVLKSHGFQPHVVVLGVEELQAAIRGNPFARAESDPKTLHLFFLAAEPPRPDMAALNRVKAGREAFVLQGKIFYMYAPHGFGTSRLAAQAEKFIGVDATARNWRTVTRLMEMAAGD